MNEENVRYRILVVDDDPDDHFFIKNAIREVDENTNLISVYNGLQGFEVLTKNISDSKVKLPDLIISDINMPIMNGIIFLEKVKHSVSLKQIPFFILSTDCDSLTKQKLLALGALDCIIKPMYSANYKVIIADMLNKVDEFRGAS